ncbi:MAG: aa3-type cytochrome c oxidase subunit IV [Methyloligellaceae bacterium]
MSVDMSGSHPDMDVEEHKATYEGFIRGSIILGVVVIALLVGMAYFLL